MVGGREQGRMTEEGEQWEGWRGGGVEGGGREG